MGAFYHRREDLPATLNLLVLSGGLLLPRGQVPLNVFEPRYLALVDTALKGNRLIGMIQPAESEDMVLKPRLTAVGCAGRLTSFHENEDGRYLITLTGVCRFRVAAEVSGETPYRIVEADFSPYIDDLKPVEDNGFPRDRLLAALHDYLSQRDLKADWKNAVAAPPETLVGALAMLCPFSPAEKQALLEAPTWPDRVETLIALLEMANMTPPGAATVN
jgi:Lon protease-like protein